MKCFILRLHISTSPPPLSFLSNLSEHPFFSSSSLLLCSLFSIVWSKFFLDYYITDNQLRFSFDSLKYFLGDNSFWISYFVLWWVPFFYTLESILEDLNSWTFHCMTIFFTVFFSFSMSIQFDKQPFLCPLVAIKAKKNWPNCLWDCQSKVIKHWTRDNFWFLFVAVFFLYPSKQRSHFLYTNYLKYSFSSNLSISRKIG